MGEAKEFPGDVGAQADEGGFAEGGEVTGGGGVRIDGLVFEGKLEEEGVEL